MQIFMLFKHGELHLFLLSKQSNRVENGKHYGKH